MSLFVKSASKHNNTDMITCATVLSQFGFTSTQTLLHVNCGKGELEEFVFKKYGIYVMAIDVSAKSIKTAKARNISDRINFYTADFLTFSGGKFDYVVFTDAVSFSDAEAARLAEVLEEEGRFIILSTGGKTRPEDKKIIAKKFCIDIDYEGDFKLLSGHLINKKGLKAP